ncbi:hypothetical protein AAMO2058_001687300 [Amorphochlora amoebiformis]
MGALSRWVMGVIWLMAWASQIMAIEATAIATLVLLDPTIVDVSIEGARTLAIASLSSNVSVVSAYAPSQIDQGLLDPYNCFVLPELEFASFDARLTPQDRSRLRDWITDNNHTLVLHGDFNGNAVSVLNNVFSYNLNILPPPRTSRAPFADKTGSAVNTGFENLGIPQLLNIDAVYPVYTISVPATAKVIYQSPDKLEAWVVEFPEGLGRSVFIAYDFFLRDDFGGWDSILQTAVQAGRASVSIVSTGFPTPFPSPPTRSPSMLSRSPSSQDEAISRSPTVAAPQANSRQQDGGPVVLLIVFMVLVGSSVMAVLWLISVKCLSYQRQRAAMRDQQAVRAEMEMERHRPAEASPIEPTQSCRESQVPSRTAVSGSPAIVFATPATDVEVKAVEGIPTLALPAND